MSVEDFIIWTYCWVDSKLEIALNGTPLRSRGFAPSLSDAEVITMEIVGEFLGQETDKGIWLYFKEHWLAFFPGMGSRSNFAKQASHLWRIKQRLHEIMMTEMAAEQESIHIIDGFPIAICHFRRAPNCRKFKGIASFGYCASKQEYYYGFQGHLVIGKSGFITGFTVSSANAGERKASFEVTENIAGALLGDKGYLGDHYAKELQAEGLQLSTPVRKNMKDKEEKIVRKFLNNTRRRVETVIGQLVDRFSISKVWARDQWHLTNRMARKILSHSIGMLCLKQMGLDSMELDAVLRAN